MDPIEDDIQAAADEKKQKMLNSIDQYNLFEHINTAKQFALVLGADHDHVQKIQTSANEIIKLQKKNTKK